MLHQFFRDSVFGRAVYVLSGRKWFVHKEERPDYVIPDKYLGEKTDSETGLIFVSWDGEDDPDSPYNWKTAYKVFFCLQVIVISITVYGGAAMYLPGIEQLMDEFGCSHAVAVLPMTLYVFGYGLGPAVFAPLSENARFGRASIYVVTLYVAAILLIPAMLVHNIASLSVLRFLVGFFCSPVLATGGASLADIFRPPYIPMGLAVWSWAGFSGLSLGGLFGSAISHSGGWRWNFYALAILVGSVSIFITLFMPETYEKTLLSWKAQRLRRVTGNPNIVALGETEHSHLNTRQLAVDTLWRPFEIMATEPVVLLIDVYLALVYAISYLWFEAFPIVFSDVYGFTMVETGAAYLSIIVGVGLGSVGYMVYMYHKFTRRILAHSVIRPEVFLPPGIVGAVLAPVGLFIFGWSATARAHWMGPMVGAAIFGAAGFLSFQTLLGYLGMSFPRFAASVFGGAAFSRSLIAGAFPIFGRALYDNLAISGFPVGWGTSVLGFISSLMIGVLVVFYRHGEKLRARSKYSG